MPKPFRPIRREPLRSFDACPAALWKRADKLKHVCTNAAYGYLYDLKSQGRDFMRPEHRGLRERIEAANACLTHIGRAAVAADAGNCVGVDFYVRQAAKKAVRATRRY